jgi:hypothetical protein
MKDDLYYTNDFGVIEHKVKEEEYIKLLEQNDTLKELIKVTLSPIVDALYKIITRGGIIDSTLLIVKSDDTVNDIISTILVDDDLYKEYSIENVSTKLFPKVKAKFINRIFNNDGYNNLHGIECYVHGWLETNLAKLITEDRRFSSSKNMLKMIEQTELLDIFFLKVVEFMPQQWIERNLYAWLKVDDDPENIVDIHCRNKEGMQEYVKKYQNAEGFSPWKLVKTFTQGADYAVLTEKYSLITYAFLYKDIHCLVNFLDYLKLPLLQDCVFHYVYLPSQYMTILKEVVLQKNTLTSDFSCLLLIVLKNYFNKSLEISGRLAFYERDEKYSWYNTEYFKKGKEKFNLWQEEREKNYAEILSVIRHHVDQANIEEWIFSYKPVVEYPDRENLHNLELKTLLNIYKNVFSDSMNIANIHTDFNLQKFNFYMDFVMGNKIVLDSECIKAILNTFISYLRSENFFWNLNFDNFHCTAMAGIAFLLSEIENPLEEIYGFIRTFLINHEGWMPNHQDAKLRVNESFVLCCIALLFERDRPFNDTVQKEKYFKEFLNLILIQYRFSHDKDSEYYKQPLSLLFEVVNQVYLDQKSYLLDKVSSAYDSPDSLIWLHPSYSTEKNAGE